VTADRVLLFVFLAVAICVMAVLLYMMVIEAIEEYENRYRGRRRSVEAEWRIQQIGSDARAQMWEEATRHREDGGGGSQSRVGALPRRLPPWWWSASGCASLLGSLHRFCRH
jgi:hypothetical protein